jgi:hypothetical protein
MTARDTMDYARDSARVVCALIGVQEGSLAWVAILRALGEAYLAGQEVGVHGLAARLGHVEART